MMAIIACDFNDLESFYQPLVAILKNGFYGHQGTNLGWPNTHFCSQYIYQHICQIWCLYHKMNNWFDIIIIIKLYCHIQRALHDELECSLALTHIVPIYTIT